MGAINRVLGFLILAISVQFIADGALDLMKMKSVQEHSKDRGYF
jgi:small neutral amino acid transporter SnatA (MarC family)